MFTECFYFLYLESVSCNCGICNRGGVSMMLTASTRDGSRSNIAENFGKFANDSPNGGLPMIIMNPGLIATLC